MCCMNCVLTNCSFHHYLYICSDVQMQILLSTHADRQGVDISFTVCNFVCTVTDFSTKDKASSVKFCTVVHRRPGQGISHFGELCSPRNSPRSPKWDFCVCAIPVGLEHAWPVRLPIRPARWPRTG